MNQNLTASQTILLKLEKWVDNSLIRITLATLANKNKHKFSLKPLKNKQNKLQIGPLPLNN